MGILDKVKSLLPKRKEPELKNNVPKEKETIRKTFGKYCNANHGTTDEKLCAKCTAVLSTVMIKISRCPYGIGKPVCEQCETHCFGERFTNDFLEIMRGGQKKMLMSHPIMTVKHKLASLGAEYAKMQRDKNLLTNKRKMPRKLKQNLQMQPARPKKRNARKNNFKRHNLLPRGGFFFWEKFNGRSKSPQIFSQGNGSILSGRVRPNSKTFAVNFYAGRREFLYRWQELRRYLYSPQRN